MSAAQRTTFASWTEELKHRDAVARKYEKVKALEALLEEWDQKMHDSEENYQYVLDLRARLRSARTQFTSMKP